MIMVIFVVVAGCERIFWIVASNEEQHEEKSDNHQNTHNAQSNLYYNYSITAYRLLNVMNGSQPQSFIIF